MFAVFYISISLPLVCNLMYTDMHHILYAEIYFTAGKITAFQLVTFSVPFQQQHRS
jgi:hypothetical protein